MGEEVKRESGVSLSRTGRAVHSAWCLPSDRIRRGGPLVVSFLFKPESICSRTPSLHDGQATVVWCRREEALRGVDVEEESRLWAGQGSDSESSAGPRFVGL